MKFKLPSLVLSLGGLLRTDGHRELVPTQSDEGEFPYHVATEIVGGDQSLKSANEVIAKVLVGFHSLEKKNDFIMTYEHQKLKSLAAGKRKQSKIKRRFKYTEAIAMEVTRGELLEMKANPDIAYIEDDGVVRKAKSFPTNSTHMRLLGEAVSDAIVLTQGNLQIPLPPVDDSVAWCWPENDFYCREHSMGQANRNRR
jgi:hypothetical protein